MPQQTYWYRAYHLTSDGHIARVELVEADDDMTALRKLKTLPNRYGIELWDRARVVGKAAPNKPTVAADQESAHAMAWTS